MILITLFSTISILQITNGAKTITVPDDYSTIQAAINAADIGDRVYLKAGTYAEKVVVNKTIKIIGQDKETTIIDGSYDGTVLTVRAANVTVAGLTVRNSGLNNEGISVKDSPFVNISSNILRNNFHSVKIEDSNNTTVTGNDVQVGYGIYGGSGIHLSQSPSSSIIHNTLRGPCLGSGIGISRSDWSVLRHNTISNDIAHPFWLDMPTPWNWIQYIMYHLDIDTSNTIDGKPIYYLVNQRDLAINPSTFPEVGYLSLVNSTNICVENLSAYARMPAPCSEYRIRFDIMLVDTSNSTIKNTTGYTISLYRSSDNEIYENANTAIYMDNSDDNFIGNNANLLYVHLDGDCFRNFIDKNIMDGQWAISEVGPDGIFLHDSGYNIISENVVKHYEIGPLRGSGIYLFAGSDHNTIARNTIIYNDIGVSIFERPDSNDTYPLPQSNLICENAFINNQEQHSVPSPMLDNHWDNGSHGNHWSDYNGTDDNQDGIGDTPYLINENNQDNYPLMRPPFPILPLAYIDLISPNPASEGEPVSFQGHGEDADGFIVEYRWDSDKDGFLSGQASFDISTLTVDTHTITFKVKDNDGAWSEVQTETLTINPEETSHTPKNKSAVILDPFYNEMGPFKDLLYDVQDYLEEAEYSVSVVRDDDATVEWLRRSLNHGVVLWRGHSALFPSGIGLVTGEIVTDENTEEYSEDIENERIGSITKGGTNYWAIRPEFITYYYALNRFQHSLVVVEGCSSLSDTSLASTFVNVGAGTYVGYITAVQEPLTSVDMITLFESLCEKGYTVEQAVDSVFWGKNLLKCYGDPDLRLVTYTDTTPSIAFVIHSPANLYVTDPLGRHIGLDPASGQTVVEIPEAMYTGSETEPQVIWIPEKLDGIYQVLLKGTAGGTYNLTVGLSTPTKVTTRASIGSISAEQTLSYQTSISQADVALYTFKILSPTNTTYTTTSVPLEIFLNVQTSWIAYCLDGQVNMTITGNTTLTGLPDGMHRLVVYTTDSVGNTAASETIHFTTEAPEPFPPWIVAVIVIIAAIGTAAFLLKMRKKN